MFYPTTCLEQLLARSAMTLVNSLPFPQWDFQVLGICSWWCLSHLPAAPDFLVQIFPDSPPTSLTAYSLSPIPILPHQPSKSMELVRFCLLPTSSYGILSLDPFTTERVATLTSINITKSSPPTLIFCKIQVRISNCLRSFWCGRYTILSSC